MLWLAIFDSLYILNSVLLFGIPTLYADIRGESWYAHLVPMMLPLAQIGLTGSIYLTVSISIERYTTVVHPFFKVNDWIILIIYISLTCLRLLIIGQVPSIFVLLYCFLFYTTFHASLS